MCGGGQPEPPKIVYQGPSKKEIKQNKRSLDQFRTQMLEQQTQFANQLQAQIDNANQQTDDLRAKYEAELAQGRADATDAVNAAKQSSAEALAAAGAAGVLQQVGAYGVSATQTQPNDNVQTSTAIEKKEKPKSTLKISTAALPSAAGTGLNIGV